MVGFTFGWEPLDRFGVKWAPQYVTIPPIKPYEDYDGPVYWDFYYFNLNFGRNCIAMTAKCENKEAAMRFIDQFYSPEGGLQVLFGSLGECIRKNDDGSYTILPPADPSMDPGTWKWTSALADAGPMYVADTIEVELGEDMKALVEYDEVYQPYLNAIPADSVWPGPFVKYTREETGELADLWLGLGEIINTNYSRWISEGGIDDEWDWYVSELEMMGLDRWIQIHQQAYDRLMKDSSDVLEMPQ